MKTKLSIINCQLSIVNCPLCIVLCALLLLAGCSKKPRHTFTDLVKLPMTPVKDQGKRQLCWAYAMLATIETEHLLRGDSVNLSAVYIDRVLPDYQSSMVKVQSSLTIGQSVALRTKFKERAMCQTLLNIIGRYGIVPYDVLPDDESSKFKVQSSKFKGMPTPRWVFMLGARYTPQEFAHSVCAPDEYLSLTCFPDSPYYKKIVVPVPDNWEGNRMLNVPLDTLRRHVDRALRHRHPVCWESRGHAMSVVGMARDENRRPYYIMKNSWGSRGPYDGLAYMSVGKMWHDMIAIYMTADAWEQGE